MNLPLIFLIAALVVFIIAAGGWVARWNLVAAGLALLVLSMLVAGKAHAQPAPGTPPMMPHREAPRPDYRIDPDRDGSYDHHRRRWHPGHVAYPRNCYEWRRETRYHPRLVLPRHCMRDYRRAQTP